jgi:hypothetical protein
MTETLALQCDWEEVREKDQQVLIDYSGVEL